MWETSAKSGSDEHKETSRSLSASAKAFVPLDYNLMVHEPEVQQHAEEVTAQAPEHDLSPKQAETVQTIVIAGIKGFMESLGMNMLKEITRVDQKIEELERRARTTPEHQEATLPRTSSQQTSSASSSSKSAGQECPCTKMASTSSATPGCHFWNGTWTPPHMRCKFLEIEQKKRKDTLRNS